jgi:hypothetical protein
MSSLTSGGGWLQAERLLGLGDKAFPERSSRARLRVLELGLAELRARRSVAFPSSFALFSDR